VGYSTIKNKRAIKRGARTAALLLPLRRSFSASYFYYDEALRQLRRRHTVPYVKVTPWRQKCKPFFVPTTRKNQLKDVFSCYQLSCLCYVCFGSKYLSPCWSNLIFSFRFIRTLDGRGFTGSVFEYSRGLAPSQHVGKFHSKLNPPNY